MEWSPTACSPKCLESEVVLPTNQKGDSVGKPLLKTHSELESVKFFKKFSKFVQHNMKVS